MVIFTKTATVIVLEVKKGLPDGLTDKAVAAALKIKFQPAISRDDKAISVVKEIEYEFKP